MLTSIGLVHLHVARCDVGRWADVGDAVITRTCLSCSKLFTRNSISINNVQDNGNRTTIAHCPGGGHPARVHIL